ncbi:spore germination protein GerPE [Gracilibacillus sp. S3-1-1]|uniref:Spore germination protein GerPE n=1 Tax=Gracilibacillus pellucidus TaxID=3095368 RepID=A0ACC6M4D3_9BACI|nr:spore germination protein GerPE [Gracilibacillus sp. S3-1-1]MDX8045757.1 spore germination protein GerPE [Gracilibacillus sp. S3-1-1]
MNNKPFTHRTTNVNQLWVNSVADSSVLQIGDTKELNPNADILAVQKEGGITSDQGFHFEQYPIFHTTIRPLLDQNIILGERNHYRSNIHVTNMDIRALSTSSCMQVGNVSNVHALSRTKHIRIIQSERNAN